MASEPIGIGVLTLDRERRVQSWNGWLEVATGLGAAAVRGRDIEEVSSARGSLLSDACRDVIDEGTTRVLAPAIHGCIIACPPRRPNRYYAEMQQRVTLAPLRGDAGIVGVLMTVEDVTERLVAERELVAQSGAPDWRVRADATRVLKASASREQVAELLASLEQNHDDFSVLSGALAVLVAVDRDVVQPIIQLLADPSPNLRMHAALALGAIGDADATAALIRALDDDDANVRFHAIESLGRIGAADAVGSLTRIAATGDFFLAFPAIDALARIEDPGVLPMLVSLLDYDALRPAVVDALAVLGDEDCVPALAALLNSASGEVQVTCAALERIAARYADMPSGELVIADLTSRTLTGAGFERLFERIRSRVQPLRGLVTVAGWAGLPSLPALLSVIDCADVLPDVTAAITRIGRDAVPLLIERMATGDREVRIAVASLLGGIGDRRATPVLVDALGSHDTEIVVAVVSALAALGDPDALDGIVKLFGHPDVSVRHGALAAVHSLGDPRVRAYTHAALSSDDSRVRESAVRIAGYFGFEETATGIIHALADPVEEVRRAAIDQIPLLDDPGGAALLLKALQQETPRNRAAAAHVLRSVSAPEVEAGLIAALADPDAWVRYFAADSLGVQGASSAAATELIRVAGQEGPPHVRIAALGALTRVAPVSLGMLVFPLLADPDEDLAAAGMTALGHVNGAEADARLEEAIRGRSSALRMAAASALARRATREAVAALEWAVQLGEPPELSARAIDGLQVIANSAPPAAARDAVEALVTLGANPQRRAAIIEALGSLEPERTDWLRELYVTARPDVRRLLISAGARLRHPAASAMLVDGLADPVPAVRLAAVAAIGRIGASLARELMVSLRNSDPDPGVRRAAAMVCRRHRWDRQKTSDAGE